MAYGLIYAITNSINGKRYVGLTTASIERRFENHIRFASSKDGDKTILGRAIRKHGASNFSIRELATANSSEELSALEVKYIDEFKSEYNTAEGGLFFRHTEDTKLKISRNTPNSIRSLFKGEMLTSKEIYQKLKLSEDFLPLKQFRFRIFLGWTVERASSTPMKIRTKPVKFSDRLVEFRGEKLSLEELYDRFCDKLISRRHLRARLLDGWDPERAITQAPIARSRKSSSL